MPTPVHIENIEITSSYTIEDLVDILAQRGPVSGRMMVDEVRHKAGGRSFIERWPLRGQYFYDNNLDERMVCLWRIRFHPKGDRNFQRPEYIACGLTDGGMNEAAREGKRKAIQLSKERNA